MTSNLDTNLANWPADELIMELAQLLAAERTARRIYDHAGLPLSGRSTGCIPGLQALVGFFTSGYLHYHTDVIEVWRTILDKGAVIPERLRKQYEELVGMSPELLLSTRDYQIWNSEIEWRKREARERYQHAQRSASDKSERVNSKANVNASA